MYSSEPAKYRLKLCRFAMEVFQPLRTESISLCDCQSICSTIVQLTGKIGRIKSRNIKSLSSGKGRL
jgi:hypothetical protein